MRNLEKYSWIAKKYPGLWGDLSRHERECFKLNVLGAIETSKKPLTEDAIFFVLYAYSKGIIVGKDGAKRRYRSEF